MATQFGSLNKVFLTGRLGQDPEVRFTPTGTAVATFSIATTRGVKKEDGTWDNITDWFKCIAWEKDGENAGKYLKKGKIVEIVGRLQNRDWTDENNQKHKVTEIVVTDIVVLEKAVAEETTDEWGLPTSGPAPTKSNVKKGRGGFDEVEEMDPEDIPF